MPIALLPDKAVATRRTNALISAGVDAILAPFNHTGKQWEILATINDRYVGRVFYQAMAENLAD